MRFYDVGTHSPLVGKTQTNASAGEVFADSGVLSAPSGFYLAWVVVGITVDGRFELARRNAANDADVGPIVPLRCLANMTAEYRIRIKLDPGERLVVRSPAVITGTVDAFLCAEAMP